MPDQPLKLGEPYCGNCGHRLSGLVDSSKCPECGRPIVEVLTRGGRLGKRYRSPAMLFGLPIIDVALGGTHDEPSGHAKGIIAVGDKATGGIAIGGTAHGVVAVGGRAIGVISFGGFSVGLLGAWGGVAIGGMANGGLAIGLLAFGGLALGLLATGGMVFGVYAMGGATFGKYCIGPGGTAQEAVDMFQHFTWYFGSVTFSLWSFIQPILVIVGLGLVAAIAIGLLAAWGHWRSRGPGAEFG